VSAEAVENLNTLIDYRYQQHVKAKNGQHGMGREMTGANGADAVLRVPVGTAIYEEDGETPICDLVVPGSAFCCSKVAGAASAMRISRAPPTAHRAAPIQANPRKKGDRAAIEADRRCGSHRSPNAGKSTFLSRVSQARPENRRLSVHHAGAATWKWCAATRLISCSPIFPG